MISARPARRNALQREARARPDLSLSAIRLPGADYVAGTGTVSMG